MSQNNTIRKSDKKFIAREKGRIRARVLDPKKQQELINSLYKKFLPQDKNQEIEKPDKSQRHFDGPATMKTLGGEDKKAEVKKEKPKKVTSKSK